MIRRLGLKNHYALLYMRRLDPHRLEEVQYVFMPDFLKLLGQVVRHLMLDLKDRRQVQDCNHLQPLPALSLLIFHPLDPNVAVETFAVQKIISL